jgi:hypothetical protein
MSYFAVLSDSVEFRIKACHLNLWVFPKLLGNHFFFDVGLRIRTFERRLDRIDLALPFRTNSNAYSDLYDAICNSETASLIFGRTVTTQNGKLSYHLRPADGGMVDDQIIRVPPDGAKRNYQLSTYDASIWILEFDNALQPNRTGYLRVRFECDGFGHNWQSHGWGFATKGSVFDFRVNDFRESLAISKWSRLKEKICEIENLNFFIIMPPNYFARAVSPDVHYMRTLEGSKWQSYINIGSSKNIRVPSKHIIYQWRSGSTDANKVTTINVSNPFRILMDIKVDFGTNLALLYFVSAFLIAALSQLLEHFDLIGIAMSFFTD